MSEPKTASDVLDWMRAMQVKREFQAKEAANGEEYSDLETAYRDAMRLAIEARIYAECATALAGVLEQKP